MSEEFGPGWSPRNLAHMVRFAEAFADANTLHTLCTKLSWSRFRLILCAGKKHETVELLELEKSGIRVASYWTKVLPKKLLQRKLHEAILHARQRLARRGRLLTEGGKP